MKERVAAFGRPLLFAAGFVGISCDSSTLSVGTTSDGGAGSLRAAIATANGQSGAVTIQLPNGEYTLTRCGADDSNAGGDLDITSAASVTLVGTGDDVVIRQTCAGERVIDARGTGGLTLKRVTVTGGSLTADTAEGGGIRATADVALERAVITANSAVGSTSSR
jgi:hypothetical protein